MGFYTSSCARTFRELSGVFRITDLIKACLHPQLIGIHFSLCSTFLALWSHLENASRPRLNEAIHRMVRESIILPRY